MKHLLFYDGSCGLCDRIVQFLLEVDTNESFIFAPLQGETAQKQLADLPDEMKQEDSLILIEDWKGKRKFFLLGKGAFRIFWLLGGWWSLLGWMNFLPGFLYNWGYRLVAKYRKNLFTSEVCILPDGKRFLP